MFLTLPKGGVFIFPFFMHCKKIPLFSLWRRYGFEMTLVLVVSIFGLQISLSPSFAAGFGKEETEKEAQALKIHIAAMQNETIPYGTLPISEKKFLVRSSMSVLATAYSSTPDQTDSTPFITASNTQVRHGIIATNDLPIGTQVKLPELYGDEVFVVEDRMNQRYTGKHRIDIWMSERADAKNFGVRNVNMEISY